MDKKSGRTVVAIDASLYRPAEVASLRGDPSKAKAKLGWEAKTSLEELIEMMARADHDRVKTGYSCAFEQDSVEDRKRMSVVLQDLTQSHPKRSFPPAKALAKALQDLWQGWRDYRQLWLATGWYDVHKRYRRSVLGPFWITISLGVFIVALSLLYGPLLGREITDYTPFVAFGLIAWTLISQIVAESCNVFIANGIIIRQMKAPLSIYIFGMIWRNVLIFIHNIALYVLIVLVFALYPTWATLLVIPGLILIRAQCAVDRDASRHAVHALPRYSARRRHHHADDVPAHADLVAPRPSVWPCGDREAQSVLLFH